MIQQRPRNNLHHFTSSSSSLGKLKLHFSLLLLFAIWEHNSACAWSISALPDLLCPSCPQRISPAQTSRTATSHSASVPRNRARCVEWWWRRMSLEKSVVECSTQKMKRGNWEAKMKGKIHYFSQFSTYSASVAGYRSNFLIIENLSAWKRVEESFLNDTRKQ